MIPIADSNPTSRRSIIVPLIVAADVLIFLFVQPTFRGDPDIPKDAQPIVFAICNAAIPDEISSQRPLSEAAASELDQFGRVASQVQQQECPDKSIWMSVLAAMFFHGGFLHLAGNMLFLWVFGNNIEDRMGWLGFIIFYLLAGAIATGAQVLAGPGDTTPMIGASGAIAGVLGAYLLLYPHARVKTLIMFFIITIVEIPAAVVLLAWFGLQLLQGVGPGGLGDVGVAYWAHIGGFLAGMALVRIFVRRPRLSAGPTPWSAL
ncbi:MAG: rhomboid family intramembrane serine protease [Actinomycetota bacterium]